MPVWQLANLKLVLNPELTFVEIRKVI